MLLAQGFSTLSLRDCGVDCSRCNVALTSLVVDMSSSKNTMGEPTTGIRMRAVAQHGHKCDATYRSVINCMC